MDMFPSMLYKAGGPVECHGGRFSTLIVADQGEQDAAVADGWALTTTEANELNAAQIPTVTADPIPADNAAPTRDELEAKARELGIAFDGRTSDAKLAAKIDEALKA